MTRAQSEIHNKLLRPRQAAAPTVSAAEVDVDVD